MKKLNFSNDTLNLIKNSNVADRDLLIIALKQLKELQDIVKDLNSDVEKIKNAINEISILLGTPKI